MEEVLPQLETYQTMNPGSGKPYKWNAEKSILYSIGVDKTDDKGEEKIADTKTDIFIPVVL